jgi:putative SOS response-associated peptidase YedK
MCGRVAVDGRVNQEIAQLVADSADFQRWTTSDWIQWEPRYNIAPTDDVPILMVGRDDALRFEPAFWTLVPPRSPELKAKFTFNARADKLLENGLWRNAFAKRRCILPARGYWEWTGEKGHKTPHFIHHPGGELLGLAAMYGWWQEPEHRGKDHDGWHLTATVITSDAVQTLADIHDRNPVILPKELWAHWIDPSVAGDQQLRDAAVAAGVSVASELDAYAVRPLRGDGPQLLEPAP